MLLLLPHPQLLEFLPLCGAVLAPTIPIELPLNLLTDWGLLYDLELIVHQLVGLARPKNRNYVLEFLVEDGKWEMLGLLLPDQLAIDGDLGPCCDLDWQGLRHLQVLSFARQSEWSN